MYTLQDFLDSHLHSYEIYAVYDLVQIINNINSPLKVIDQRAYVDMTFYYNQKCACYAEVKWVKDRNIYYTDSFIFPFAELIWRCFCNSFIPPVLMVLTPKGCKIVSKKEIENVINDIGKIFNCVKNIYTPNQVYKKLTINRNFHAQDKPLAEVYEILRDSIINNDDFLFNFNTSITKITSEIIKVYLENEY